MQQLTATELVTLINSQTETTIILFDDTNEHSEIMVGYGRAYTYNDTNLGVEFEEMENKIFKEFKNSLDLLKFVCYASDEE